MISWEWNWLQVVLVLLWFNVDDYFASTITFTLTQTVTSSKLHGNYSQKRLLDWLVWPHMHLADIKFCQSPKALFVVTISHSHLFKVATIWFSHIAPQSRGWQLFATLGCSLQPSSHCRPQVSATLSSQLPLLALATDPHPLCSEDTCRQDEEAAPPRRGVLQGRWQYFRAPCHQSPVPHWLPSWAIGCHPLPWSTELKLVKNIFWISKAKLFCRENN